MNSLLAYLICLLTVVSTACGEKNKTAYDYPVWGIDLSKHQTVVNWDRLLANEPPAFVFLKATEGTLITDPTYAARKKELEKRGVLVGAYHFFGHRTPGAEQADNFIRTANLQKGNMIPVLDIEPHRFFKDQKHMEREVENFCRKIKSYYGVRPILYCSTSFYRRHLQHRFNEKDYILWIADYTRTPVAQWSFWQHTDSHKIRGINGGIDRNVFSGDLDQLNQLILK